MDRGDGWWGDQERRYAPPEGSCAQGGGPGSPLVPSVKEGVTSNCLPQQQGLKTGRSHFLLMVFKGGVVINGRSKLFLPQHSGDLKGAMVPPPCRPGALTSGKTDLFPSHTLVILLGFQAC